jgi:hypothetical protein
MSIHCADCDEPIPAAGNVPSERQACPACGSQRRRYDVNVHESVGLSEFISTTHGRSGERGSHASLDDAGTIQSDLSGRSPRNEEDSQATCDRLVRVLNAQGARWTVPTPGTADADCESHDAEDRKRKLAIQVVRASNDSEMWRTLNETGVVEVHRPSDRLADELLAVIRHKHDTYRVPSQLAVLVLAIDANRLPGHTFDTVLASFRIRHRATCIGFGFREVWLVGPRDNLVFRLDL